MNPLLAALLGPVFDTINKVIDRAWPDPTEAAKIKAQLIVAQQQMDMKELDANVQLALKQMDVNQAEASSGNWYASSWRPSIGYICALAMAFQFIGHPIVEWIIAYRHLTVTVPSFDFGPLMTVVMTMLGMGTLRTFEKVKGVNS